MSTNVLALFGPPCSPSATTHLGAVRVAPKALWPSVQPPPTPTHHIVRSTMTGTPLVDSTLTDADVAASEGSSSATLIVLRLFGATVYVLTTGAPLAFR